MSVRHLSLYVLLFLAITACGRDSDPDISIPEPIDVQALQQRTFDQLWSIVNESYVYEDFNGVDWLAVKNEYQSRLDRQVSADEFDAILQTMLGELPPSTVSYETREQRIEAALEGTNSYQGIGVFVSVFDRPEPRIVLLSVMPGSPAEQAGLQAHDAILAIDGLPIQSGGEEDLVGQVRGPAGSEVTLTVRSPGEEVRDVVVERGTVQRSSQRLFWQMLPGTEVGYFLFPPIPYADLGEDFELGLLAMTEGDGLEGVILDLRIVTMGSNWPAAPLLAYFADGNAGSFYTRLQAREVDVTGVSDIADSQEIPLVVLTGPDTRGAAEIFAAVLQSFNRATIMGMTTP
jgi:carboxyl-terminal processing protease